MGMNDFINNINARKFPTLEGFRASMKKLLRYGLSEKDCISGVESACAFFNIPMPAFIADLTNKPNGQTMFLSTDKETFADDIICYDLEQLLALGVKNVLAYSLIMTHECAHRVLQNTVLPGRDDGQWEEELAADFFMGVRAGLEGFPPEAFKAVRSGLGKGSGAKSHPCGWLRSEIMSYGYTYVGNMDLIHHRKRSIDEYLALFEAWRQKNEGRIIQAHVPFYGY